MFSSSRNKRWNGKRKLSDQQVPNKKPSNQQQQTKTADLFFDFSNDPKVINARKQIETAREKIPSLSIQYDIVASSNGNVSLPGSSGSRERPVASMSDFKLASGEPITKETNDQKNSVKQLGNSRFLDNRQLSEIGLEFSRPIGPSAPFKPPWKNAASVSSTSTTSRGSIQTFNHGEQGESSSSELKSHPSLKHFDANLISLIEAEIMSVTQDTGWLDVAGLEGAKKALREIVVLPFKRPDVFKGIRSPPKGVLLFGPPGTGKTLIGKCVASQCAATFFNISASSLTSKWVGEGEKLVRALFAVARIRLPAVIFIDEIDSLLSSRNDAEHESSRRIKTEFLVQLDGLATASEERLLVLGATNRPHELDEAARRRFVKRLYIGLPEAAARIAIVRSLLVDQLHSLTEEELNEIARLSEGYSGADMRQLCAEAAMIPVRELYDRIDNVTTEEIRSITLKDFEAALQVVRKTVVDTDLGAYEKFDEKFGCLI